MDRVRGLSREVPVATSLRQVVAPAAGCQSRHEYMLYVAGHMLYMPSSSLSSCALIRKNARPEGP